jgi:hypothetical protein
MRLQIINPPRMDKTLSIKEAVDAVRHSFAVIRERGQTIVHRNQLKNIIESRLIENGFLTPTISNETERDLNLLDELLGTRSTISFVRAGLLLKWGPWYWPYPERAVVLGNVLGKQTVAILSPFASEFLKNRDKKCEPIIFEEAGLAYISNLNQIPCPWPLVDPLQLINLQPVSLFDSVQETAINFLSTELAPMDMNNRPNSVVQEIKDISYFSPSELNRYIRIRSLGRWERILNIVRNRPPQLWGGVRIRPDIYAFLGNSTYDEFNLNKFVRFVVILITPGPNRIGPPSRIIHISLKPFLTSRIVWAFRAATGNQNIITVEQLKNDRVLLNFNEIIPTGPLRTWLALIGRINNESRRRSEWEIHIAAKEITSLILAQYFAQMKEITI